MRPHSLVTILGFAVVLAACESDPNESPFDVQRHNELVHLKSASSATLTNEHPFMQVGVMMNAPTAELEYRIDGSDRWIPVDMTWSEDIRHVGRIILDEPATDLELRASADWEYANVEFFDEVVATDRLARDLPFESASASVNGLAPADLVVNRAGWGARNPDKICGSVVAPYRMAVHHTASPDSDGNIAATMRQMQAYHIDTNGWCDIGYHFVVSQAGQVYQGRSDERRPGAHVGNANSGNIGVSLIGNFENQQVSETQFAAAAEIIGWAAREYDIPFNRASIKGHREHAGQSTSCPGTNLLNRLDELIARANGAPGPNTEWDLEFDVKLVGQLDDFYTAGTSAGTPDFFPGDTLQAEISIKNANTSPLRNVNVGYSFETPFLGATNYKIESDAPGFDGATFTLNDSNDNPDNPAKDAMGERGSLGLYAFGAGETKKITVDLTVGDYSIGLADHPDVRAWMSHVDDLYGEQNAFDMEPSNTNAFGELQQAFAEIDVLSTHEWQFDGGEAEQVEGWTGPDLAVNVDLGTLHADIDANAALTSPAWTSIDAAAFDQLAMRIETGDQPHRAAIYFARDGEELSPDRAVTFIVDPSRNAQLVPIGEHPQWSGIVTKLQLQPNLDAGGTVDIDAIWFQSSTGAVGSAREELLAGPPVEVETDGAPEPAENDDDSDDDDDEPSPDALPDPETVRVNGGCSTAGSANPTWFLLVGLVVVGLRRRRR